MRYFEGAHLSTSDLLKNVASLFLELYCYYFFKERLNNE